MLSFLLSLSLAYGARKYVIPRIIETPAFSFTFKHYLLIWWLPLIFIFFIAYEGLYTRRQPLWDEVESLMKAMTMAFLMALAVVSLGKISAQVSRIVLVLFWLFSLFISPILRLWGKRVLYDADLWGEQILILGAGDAGKALAEGLERERTMGYKIVGFLDDDPEKRERGIEVHGRVCNVFGRLNQFEEIVRELGINTVAVAIPTLRAEALRELVNMVHAGVKNVLLVPELKGITLLNSELSHLFAEQLFLLKIRNNLKSPVNKFIKRFFDLLTSSVLLLLLFPLLVIIALMIRIESQGGSFYIHERWGRDGRIFKCMKFRSMFSNADERLCEFLAQHPEAQKEWNEFKKLKGFDPRVTKIGRLLRKTSLDELPQILNVIKGEMSLVGPRPYLPREKDEMGRFFSTILTAKPGMTGWWQVSGRNILSFEQRLLLDAWYVQNWSLWLDIMTLIKTLKVVLKREGAY